MDKFNTIKLLSDETRFNIFMKLMEFDNLCVSEIESLLGIKQANTSKHLKKFKEFGIVESIRIGNMIRYNIKESFQDENVDLIRYLFN